MFVEQRRKKNLDKISNSFRVLIDNELKIGVNNDTNLK